MGKAKLLGGEGIPRSKDSLVFESYGKEEIKQGNFVDTILDSNAFYPNTNSKVKQATHMLVPCCNFKYVCSAIIVNSYMYFYVFDAEGTKIISQTIIQTGVDSSSSVFRIRKIVKATEDTVIVVTNSYIIKVYITENGLAKASEPYLYSSKVSLNFGNAIADASNVYILTWYENRNDNCQAKLYKFSLEDLNNIVSLQLYNKADYKITTSDYYTTSTSLIWMSTNTLFIAGCWSFSDHSFLVDTTGNMRVTVASSTVVFGSSVTAVARINADTIIALWNSNISLYTVNSSGISLKKSYSAPLVKYPTVYSSLYVKPLSTPNTYSVFFSGSCTSASNSDTYSPSISNALSFLAKKQTDGTFTIDTSLIWDYSFGDYSWENSKESVKTETNKSIMFYKDNGFVLVPSNRKVSVDFSISYNQISVFNSTTFCITHNNNKSFYVYTVDDDCNISEPVLSEAPGNIAGYVPFAKFNKNELIGKIGSNNYLVSLQSDNSLKFQKLNNTENFYNFYPIDSNRFFGIVGTETSSNVFLYELNRASWTLTKKEVSLPDSFSYTRSSAFLKVKDGILLFNGSAKVCLLKVLSDNTVQSIQILENIYAEDIIRTSRKTFKIVTKSGTSYEIVLDDTLENMVRLEENTHVKITNDYSSTLRSMNKRYNVSGSPYSCIHFWNTASNNNTSVNMLTLINTFINFSNILQFGYNWGSTFIPVSLNRSKILLVLSDNKSVAIADLSNVLIRGNSALTLNKATPAKKGKVLISGGIENDSFTYDDYE